ncbi:MAG TPA: DHA2 family efflux MFS transporter permease subunit [Thermoleophilaceae bacterium]
MARRWKVLTVAAVAVFIGFLDVTIVNVAFPDIQREFSDSSQADLSWVLNAYNVVFAALLVPSGRLADIVGRKRMFMIGLLVFLAASAACGAAGSVEMLVGARIVQAVGGAILVPTSLALLLPEFPASQRATATSIWTATGAVAAAVGPSLGGVLVDQADWRWVFFANIPIGIAALIPARRILQEHREPGALPDAVGAVLLVAGVGLLALGIVKGQDWGWDSTRVVASLAAGVLLVPLVIARSLRHPAPVIDPSLFRSRSFSVAVAGTFAFSFAFYALILGNVLFLTQVWGWSILSAGFAITPGPLMAALSAPVGGRLSDRFGQRPVAVPGALLFAAGSTWFALRLGTTPHYARDYLAGTLMTGTGVGLSYAAWASAAVAELPSERFASGSAVVACLRQVGAVLGIAVLIAVLQSASPADPVGAFASAYTVMAVAALVAAGLGFALGRVRAVAGRPIPEAA